MRTIKILATMTFLSSLAGCGSVAYVNAGSTFTVAGQAATKALSELSTDVSASQDYRYSAAIVHDRSCPINIERIFIRDPNAPRGVFVNALQQIPELSGNQNCQTLARCDTAGGNECGGICYSSSESDCIASIEGSLNHEFTNLKKKKADTSKFLETNKPFFDTLDRTEYKRTKPVKALISEAPLTALLGYLDLLSKAINYPKSNVGEDAKNLSSRADNAYSKIKQITGAELSAADLVSFTNAKNVLSAFGALIGDLQNIAAANDAAERIRAAVTKNSVDADQLIAALTNFATGDIDLAYRNQSGAWFALTNILQKEFNKETTSDYERLALLDKRNSLPSGNEAEKNEKINKIKTLFATLQQSNAALTKLVLKPDDKDQQAINGQRFQEFKQIAGDIGTLVGSVK